MPADTGRLRAEDAVLCVIDLQPGFVDRLESSTTVIERVAWLVSVAGALEIPVAVTEEEPDRNGGTVREVADRLPPGTRRHVKPIFGLADVPEILEDVSGTGRNTAVLTGMETDVCVAQSALGLIDRGFRVAVVLDAVASPGPAHEQGIERLRGAGAVLVGAKALYYEWAHSVEGAHRLGASLSGLPTPADLNL